MVFSGTHGIYATKLEETETKVEQGREEHNLGTFVQENDLGIVDRGSAGEKLWKLVAVGSPKPRLCSV